MVHALREAWRVLAHEGILIDQRPLSSDTPLEIIHKDKSHRVGMLDLSPGLIHDIAADQSVANLIKEGIFRELSTEQFQITYYWNTVRGMMGDIRERWLEDIRLDMELIHSAYQLFGKFRSHRRVRLIFPMKLTKYEKVSIEKK
jgi:hypothetical protein